VFTNLRAVEDYRTRSYEAFISYPACVHDSVVSDGNAIPNYSRIASGTMDDDIILDAAVRTYSYVAVVTT